MTDSVAVAVADERDRQTELWGDQSHHPDGTGPIFADAARTAKMVCEEMTKAGTLSWLDILMEEFFEAAEQDDPEKLYVELVQVAAVASSWASAIRQRAA